MSTTVAVIADTHINSTVGLCTPQISLDDGGDYRASQGQRWLWRNWLDFWEQLPKADRLIGIFNGDLVESDAKQRSTQIITRNRSTILRMAVDVLEPALDKCDAVYIIRGTEAHTGKSGELEEALAQDITSAVIRDTSASWWHLQAECEGVRFNIAHHASMGRLPHTEKNAANKIAYLVTWHYVTNGIRPPHIAIRSHNHRYADSGRNYEPVMGICTPAWTLKTAYGYRISAENGLPAIGGLWFLCEDGSYTWDLIQYKPSMTATWKQKI